MHVVACFKTVHKWHAMYRPGCSLEKSRELCPLLVVYTLFKCESWESAALKSPEASQSAVSQQSNYKYSIHSLDASHTRRRFILVYQPATDMHMLSACRAWSMHQVTNISMIQTIDIADTPFCAVTSRRVTSQTCSYKVYQHDSSQNNTAKGNQRHFYSIAMELPQRSIQRSTVFQRMVEPRRRSKPPQCQPKKSQCQCQPEYFG